MLFHFLAFKYIMFVVLLYAIQPVKYKSSSGLNTPSFR